MYQYFVLLSVLLLPTISAQCIAGNNCINGTCLQPDDACSCQSGFEGVACDVGVNPLCQFELLDALNTDHYPVLDDANTLFDNNVLQIRLTSPLVADRLNTKVYLNDPDLYPQCSYPASGNWQKLVDGVGCEDVFEANIPWDEGINCGWTVDSTSEEGYTSYNGDIFVQHFDKIDEFRGDPITRETIHVIPMRIRFKTSVEVSTSLNIFAPVNLLAAITEQTYDPEINEGIVAITTSLQWPFQLEGVVLDDFPTNMSAVVIPSDLDCPDPFTSSSALTSSAGEPPCDQLYTIDLTPLQACTLTGSYDLSFIISCRGDPADCPLDADTDSVVINATVNSEDFCVGVELDVGLSGVMNVYEDAAYSIPKDDFLFDQTAHFEISLTVDGGVSLEASEIEEIRLVDDAAGTTVFLMQNSIATADGLNCSLSIDNTQPIETPGFNFVPNNRVTPVNEDQNDPFTVYAIVNVGYLGGPSLAKREIGFPMAKRQNAQDGETDAQTAIGIIVGGPEGVLDPNSGGQLTNGADEKDIVDTNDSAYLSVAALFFSLFW